MIIAAMLEIKVQAIIGRGQDPEQVQIGIEFDIISVGYTIISQKTVPLTEMKRK